MPRRRWPGGVSEVDAPVVAQVAVMRRHLTVLIMSHRQALLCFDTIEHLNFRRAIIAGGPYQELVRGDPRPAPPAITSVRNSPRGMA